MSKDKLNIFRTLSQPEFRIIWKS